MDDDVHFFRHPERNTAVGVLAVEKGADASTKNTIATAEKVVETNAQQERE